MLYYSNDARNSAQNRIKELKEIINSAPGDVIPYAAAADLTRYLTMLSNLIEKEKREKR